MEVIPHDFPFVRPASGGFAVASRKFLKFAFAGWLCTSPISAKERPEERVADDVLTLRVQSAIAEDPTLKPHHLNLLVNLVDGMAVIGGELPDMKLLPQVERVARNVPGVRAVKVSGWLPAGSSNVDPYTKRLNEQLGQAKPLAPPRVEVLGPPPLNISPQPFDPNAVSRKPLVPGNMLMEPVMPGKKTSVAAPGAEPLPYPTIPPPGVPTQPIVLPAASLPWEELRRSDERFAGLDVLNSGRGYTVVGRAAKLTDAWDFAQKLQALPGIDAVVVGRIETR
jgi:hypothetical protein